MSEPACEMVLEGPKAGDTFSLKLTSPFVDQPLVLNGRQYSHLAAIGKQVRASLELSGIGRRGLRKNPDATKMRDDLETIRENGWTALSGLTGARANAAQPAQLYEYLTKVLTGAPRTTIPVLRFESPLDLPIDVMPALQPRRERFSVPDKSILYEQACTWFLGLQFAVQKILLGTEDSGPDVIESHEFSGSRRVVLAPYWHRGLAGVQELLKDLRDLGFFEVLRALPDDSKEKWRHGREAADRMVRGRRAPEGPEASVHIVCHCDAHDGLPLLDHCLRLQDRTELKVTVNSLMSSGPGIAQHGPLAVITACGASNEGFDSPVSIPDALLYAGFRSVVSPLVSVEVGPGYAVTLYLYAALKERMTVGAALVKARRILLREHGHTLGLLHTCYGNAGLHLDEEVVTSPHPDRIPV